MPKVIVIEKTVFEFSELSERAKDRARDWYRRGCCNDWEPNFWEFEGCAKKLGIEFRPRPVRLMSGKTRNEPDINYSVGDRGEYCVFAGDWTYRPEAVAEITADGWTDTTLLDIAKELQRAWTLIQLSGGTTLTASMRTRSTGCSSMSMDIEVQSNVVTPGMEDDEFIPEPVAMTVGQAMKDFADWMLKQMSDDWQYQYSDECADEGIMSNEYTFDEDGDRED